MQRLPLLPALRTLLAPLVLAFGVAGPGHAHAQTVHVDPAGRFTLEVPKNWNVVSGKDGVTTLSTRSAAVTIEKVVGRSPEQVLDATLAATAGRWTRFAETERGTTTLAGVPATVVLATGVNPRGVASIYRLAVGAFADGVIVLAASVPKEQFGLTRIALENIEESLAPGRNTPAPAAVNPDRTDRAILEEAYKARMLTAEEYAAARDALEGTSSRPGPAAPKRAMLGVRTTDLGDEDRDRLRIEQGAMVRQVSVDSPAHGAGVQVGDVITSVDDIPIPDSRALIQSIARRHPGDPVRLRVVRDGLEREVQATLGPTR